MWRLNPVIQVLAGAVSLSASVPLVWHGFPLEKKAIYCNPRNTMLAGGKENKPTILQKER